MDRTEPAETPPAGTSPADTHADPASTRRGRVAPPADELRRQWDLGRWQEWSRTPRGFTNHSFFVSTDRGRFVARVSNPRKTEALMAAEVALLEHLRSQTFPAPRVVPTRDGRPWATVDGALCLVTERIPGEYPQSSNRGQLRECGRALARFHAVTRDLPGAARPAAESELAALGAGPELLGRLGDFAAARLSGEDLDRFRRAADALAPAFAAVAGALARDGALPEELTHGSLGKSAILFEGERLTGVLDYERVVYDARIMDIAYLLRSMTRNRGERGAFHTDRFATLVGGYRAEERLTAAEVDRIPAAMQAHSLLRVRGKAVNLLTKDETVPQDARDILKVVEKPMELEVSRLRWIDAHGDELVAAMEAAA